MLLSAKKKSLLSTMLVAVISLFISAAVHSTELQEYVQGQLICNVWDAELIDSISLEFGAELYLYDERLYDYLLVTDTLRDTDSLAREIAKRPGVIYCEPNYLLYAPEPVQASQPFIDAVGGGNFHQQAAAQTLMLDSTHAYTTGSSATVAVIDVGVDFSHPLLTTDVESGFDYVDWDSVSSDELGGAATGHGTFIAGIVRLVAPDAVIRAYRVLDADGFGDGYHIALAMVQAVDDGCDVLNLSLVMSGEHPTVTRALEYAQSHEVVVVAAAGNDSALVDRFPASSMYSVSVAAVDSFGFKADFSNFSTTVNLVAPGTGIYAPFPQNSYAWWNGTSFAAPFVSGQAALLFALDPEATSADIMSAIYGMAINLDSLNPGYVGLLGSGLIDPLATVTENFTYFCGDFDNDGLPGNINDLTFLVDFIFRSGPIPANLLAANCDGVVGKPNIVDLTCLVDFIFRSGGDPDCTP